MESACRFKHCKLPENLGLKEIAFRMKKSARHIFNLTSKPRAFATHYNTYTVIFNKARPCITLRFPSMKVCLLGLDFSKTCP